MKQTVIMRLKQHFSENAITVELSKIGFLKIHMKYSHQYPNLRHHQFQCFYSIPTSLTHFILTCVSPRNCLITSMSKTSIIHIILHTNI